METMRIIYLLISTFCFILIFNSCKTYEYKFGVPRAEVQNKVLADAGYLKVNEAYLFFTTNYNNVKIKVIQKDSLIFNGEIKTVDGIAKRLKVKKNANVQIFIQGISKQLEISEGDMSGYKSIYIYKNKSKGYVYFYDGSVVFQENNAFFPVYNEKEYNCKITEIDSSENSYLIKFHKTGLFKKKKEELIIVANVDTIIKDLPKLKIGNNFKFKLSDKFYNEMMSKMRNSNENKFYYDTDKKLIWEMETDRKFYTTDNLINLYYKKE